MSSPQRSFAQKYFGPEAVCLLFTTTGILHLVTPSTYEQIMPPQLPAHRELVLISGVAEIVGGWLFLFKKTRPLGALWLIALLIAVFPSNVYMMTLDKFQRSIPGGKAALIARLPLQFVMIWWIRRLAARTATPTAVNA